MNRITSQPSTSVPAAALHLEEISKRYGEGAGAVDAVRQVGLQVDYGELVAVTGASGSGKSTLLTIAGGLERADSGQVVVAGEDLAELDVEALYAHRRRHIGYVFQDYNLIPTLTAVENVALPAELDGERPRAARQGAGEALARVGLADLGTRFPAQLSGGQQQRVAIARAVSGSRRLLLADEPTGALDSSTAEEVLDLIAALVADGAAAVLVTHDSRVAARADRVVRLQDGRIVATPTASSVDRGDS